MKIGTDPLLRNGRDRRITPADISDPQEVIARAQALSRELATTITPWALDRSSQGNQQRLVQTLLLLTRAVDSDVLP